MKDNRKKPVFSVIAGALAQRGLHVFPLIENAKEPDIKGFPANATGDQERIDTWGRNKPHRNVGVSTTDSFFGPLVVVDIDDKNDRNGSETIKAHAAQGRVLTETLLVRTPSGGFHAYYFPPYPLKQGKDTLGDGVDTRANGGYVVGPGSIIDGVEYVIIKDRPIASAPQWVVDMSGRARQRDPKTGKKAAGGAKLDNIDGEWAGQTFKAFLEAQGVVGRGHQDETIMRAAREAHDLGVDEDEALALIIEHLDLDPVPEDWEIEGRVERAYENCENPQGCRNPQAVFMQGKAAGQSGRWRLEAPRPDAELTGVLGGLDKVLSAVKSPAPPMRSPEGSPVYIKAVEPWRLHELTAEGVNDGDDPETRRAAAPVVSIVRHTVVSMKIEIEKHIEYFKQAKDKPDRIVGLQDIFVKSYLEHPDSKLPIINGVQTLPIVLTDGELLATNGLDAKRRVYFEIDPVILSHIKTGPITDADVKEAMSFLIDEVLCDVAADFVTKCGIIALMLTAIERMLLKERLAFFVYAGRRGGGKTTLMHMVSMIVSGVRAAATAWSEKEEERRKALLPLMRQGAPFIVFDNIKRGTKISCPHVEAMLTTDTQTDRVLGESNTETVSSTSIPVFTGNNIGPKGDMLSRSLMLFLKVTRPDPENRNFKRADWESWVLENRGKILSALYVILRGNPKLREKSPELGSRFKKWMLLVGSAVEHAARLYNPDPKPEEALNFAKILLDNEKSEENESDLAGLLRGLNATIGAVGEWFTAAQVLKLATSFIDPQDEAHAAAVKAFFPVGPRGSLTTNYISRKLKENTNNPVEIDGESWVIRSGENRKVAHFQIGKGDDHDG